jgi:hypothetical protein
MKNYKKFLNETMITLNSIFKTEISSKFITAINLNEYLNTENLDITPKNAYVSWRLNPDFSPNKIDSMGLIVTRVECEIIWENNIESDIIEIDTHSLKFKEWVINEHIEFEKNGAVMPTAIDINFNEKSINIF